jgi:hypothetical protein
MHIHPRHVFGNPYKTLFFPPLCLHGQKKYNMLPSMWYNIRRKMKIKVQKEEKGERGWDK